jgi:hypothetical protein
MNEACEPSSLTVLLALAGWLGDIIRSLFPWPAIVLVVLLFPPLRHALDRIFTALADSMRTLRRLKAAGVELTLDPEAARLLSAKSTAVVLDDYKRKADQEVARLHVWETFTRIIEDVVRPLAEADFRSTIHVEDVLQPETLYQLVEYVHVSDPPGPPNTRGRRNSIRFGIIGRAWRLGRSEYEPKVTTDIGELVRAWGMTQDEAIRAGRGRQSFAVILLRAATSGYSGLIFVDAELPGLFGKTAVEELEARINQAAAGADGLSNNLARLRDALAQEFRSPTQR